MWFARNKINSDGKYVCAKLKSKIAVGYASSRRRRLSLPVRLKNIDVNCDTEKGFVMAFISNNQWVIPLLLFLIIAIIGIVLGAKNIRREKGIQQKARELGFFVGTQESIKEITNIPAFFLLTPQGSHVQFRQIRNIIKGRISDLDFVMFDYISKFSKGRINTATVLALPLPAEDVPDFSLAALDQFSSIHKRVIEQSIKKKSQIDYTRGKQVKFSSAPEFQKNYFLYSRDEQAARKLFDVNTLKLLSKQSSKGWGIACENGWMNLSHNDKTVKPECLHDFLKESTLIYRTILQQFPVSRV
ncbi:MAG: hypothetical protein L3J63_01105 [Geopsychrobacter sp.]|nr:hypothetical protein [Geopsychrobacter sp.]